MGEEEAKVCEEGGKREGRNINQCVAIQALRKLPDIT